MVILIRGYVVKKAVDELNIDSTMHVVDLNKIKISPYDYKNKNKNDDYLGLMEKILTYNSIILATPVYWYTMSAQMKIFFDRLTDCMSIRKDIGRKLKGKRVYVLASYTSPAKGFEDPFSQTCKYMKMHYGGCFFHYAGEDEKLLRKNKKISEFRNLILKHIK